MKGQQWAVLGLFWLMCVLVIWVGSDIGLRMIKGGRAYELPVKIDVYSMQNALDASKVYMDTGTRYSVYQACYDLLKDGGWPDLAEVPASERVVIGNEVFGPIRTSAEFRTALTETVLKNINTYSADDYEFFEVYEVHLPSYSEVELVEFMPSRLTVKATSAAPLRICRPSSCEFESAGGDGTAGEAGGGGSEGSGDGSSATIPKPEQQPNIVEKVVLQKPSGLEETIETPCYGLYRQAIDEADRLTGIINSGFEVEMDRLKAGVAIAAGGNCNSLVDAAAKSVEDSLKADNIEVIDVTFGFAQIDYDSSSGMCYLRNGNADATVKASVKGPDDKTFPVWNGQELAFEPLEVVFTVKASYDSAA